MNTIRRELLERDYLRMVAASPPKWRDVWRALWLTGVRVGELAALTPRQVDFDAGLVYVEAHDGWQPKTRRPRAIPLTAELREILERRIRDFPARLFPDRKTIQKRMLRLARKLGLENVTPHSFRHAFASRMLRGGGDLKTVADVLGHASVGTTNRYLHADLEKAREIMARLGAQAV